MKEKPAKTENDIDELLRDIKQKTGLTQEGIAGRINYNRSYLSQAKKTDSEKLYSVLYKEFRGELENLTTAESNEAKDSELLGKPMIQVVLNLSYIGRKNADSMDKMAATNQRNTEIIAALVATMLPNSKFAGKLAASLADLHEEDEVPPIEEMLNKAGNEFLKKQMQQSKKVTKGK